MAFGMINDSMNGALLWTVIIIAVRPLCVDIKMAFGMSNDGMKGKIRQTVLIKICANVIIANMISANMIFGKSSTARWCST